MMKKLFALLIALLLLTSAAGAEMMCGGWQVTESPELDDVSSTVLAEALKTYTGVEMEPVALLGTQVVAGVNYSYLCRVTPVVPGAEGHYAVVTVYQALNGECTILSVEDIQLGENYAEEACTFEFSALAGQTFDFSSGVGGWMTSMTIDSDGSFSGEFHDSEMGQTGEGYPNGAVYGCSFKGTLSVVRQISDYSWELKIETMTVDAQQEYISDGILFIPAEPYGLTGTDSLTLYAPFCPVTELPVGFVSWAKLGDWYDLPETLPYWGIYNAAADCGFVTGAVE